MSIKITRKDEKILCIKSGNRCKMPNCHKEWVINKTENNPNCIIEVMTHIKGEKQGAARFDMNIADKQRNFYGNLILL